MSRIPYSPLFVVQSAQNLRSRMSMGEEQLWVKLSSGFDGARFRRNHPIGNHVVAFYCRKLKLIVEVDALATLHHKDRDSYLVACGYSVLRFTEKEIAADILAVVAKINDAVLCALIQDNAEPVKDISVYITEYVKSVFKQKRYHRHHAGSDFALSSAQ